MNEIEKQRLYADDRKYVWHPFTQMKDYEKQDHVLIEKAEGLFLIDADGRRYYDTISSWWVNVHGHSHPRIQQALQQQMQKIDHVMFSGFSHPPAIELSRRLVELTPAGLEKVFYSDNGSTAVEVALKMSFQYWQQVGKPSKTKFVYIENSYHGDTIGAVSVGGVNAYHAMFRPLMFSAYAVPSPNVFAWLRNSNSNADSLASDTTYADAQAHCVSHCIDAVRHRLESSADEIAAVIVEPMIQAAGGMNIYPALYLQELRKLCTQFHVHLIADEVAVGFGRTGKMFACEHANISPDLMCLSKGITGGVLPLAATLCTQEIYDAFYDDYETQKTFTHGHSYTANPLATAVALESLLLFEEQSLLNHVADMSAHLSLEIQRFSPFEQVADIRSLGMVAAFDLWKNPASKIPFAVNERIGYRIYLEGLNQGLLLRPLGNTIYYWLPLVTRLEELRDIVMRTERTLHRVLSSLDH
jgi:adenosylmethionine-8-amino-7-oxononanoate aminotransferase